MIQSGNPTSIVIASPNNPTGTAVELATVRALCEVAAGVVVIDEAYYEFARAGTPSALELLPEFPRLAVTRTMSKAFAFAGRPARVPGRQSRPSSTRSGSSGCPYHLSAVTQAVARVALAHAPEMLAAVDALRRERDDLARWLADAGLDVAESDANFVLFGRFDDRHRIWQALLDRGVLIRETGPDGWLRVSAGTPEEMAALPDRAHRCTRARRTGAQMTDRTAQIERITSESKVSVGLDVDGTGRSTISTGVGFYDHMLTALAKHALLDLEVTSVGDVHIDGHHVVEDTAIVLGQALRQALGDKRGIRRFGDALVPLDEALAQAVVDVSGRPYCVHTGEPAGQEYVLIGGGPSTGSGNVGAWGSVRGVAHPARVRDAGLSCAPVPARHRACRSRSPPHRGGPVQGARPGVCGMRSPSIRGWRGCRAPRVLYDRVTKASRGPGLRFWEPAVGGAGGGSGRRVGGRDRRRAIRRSRRMVSSCPGSGAFAACMAGLSEVGGPKVMATRIARDKPTLAICVGHQVLFESGIEHGAEHTRLRRLARCRGAAGGRSTAAHGLELGAAGRLDAVCSPGSRPSSSTSCTPTPCAAGRRARPH